MRIIPAIDIIDGKCVRLTKGDYSTKKIYNEDPLEVAKAFEDRGIKYLHLVDLDGAKSDRIVNYDVLSMIATHTNLQIDFGGGLKRSEDVKIAFSCGAHQITAGSIAATQSDLFLNWLEEYGSDHILLGADCKDRKIATHGWQQELNLDVVDFISAYEEKGIRQVICTDIAKDGMLLGPSFNLYTEILAKTSVRLIASGGISTLEDLQRLKEQGCEGAILGKAIYEGNIALKELERLC
jgi:phosphoribosylformimino-5-aminoimidazole carboxamide ribotide isomerase